MTKTWNHAERLLSERSSLAGWLGVPTGTPQGYRARKGHLPTSLGDATPRGWDDDDVAGDEEEEEDDFLPDDDEDELEDDEDDDDADADDDV